VSRVLCLRTFRIPSLNGFQSSKRCGCTWTKCSAWQTKVEVRRLFIDFEIQREFRHFGRKFFLRQCKLHRNEWPGLCKTDRGGLRNREKKFRLWKCKLAGTPPTPTLSQTNPPPRSFVRSKAISGVARSVVWFAVHFRTSGDFQRSPWKNNSKCCGRQYRQEFHRECYGRANTRTVMLDTKANAFGGFTPVKWESPTSCPYGKADDSLKGFLFKLKNPPNILARRFARPLFTSIPTT
jgi:hypothetical protein